MVTGWAADIPNVIFSGVKIKDWGGSSENFFQISLFSVKGEH